ncbi:Dipeptidyl aminopeptidase/acylaminoacyl peptidase [Cryobacterium flavum]|uniref:Dipeptidyl aminopeptidase/acylaminoacyl peptidase n=1 Tax=Cryobacterium flavum TaxID=1424659 RepID=A0A4R8UWB1_9MICO|nr:MULTISPECIES: prolyl oligopeptidase family serine peptidase [Cryobacterium]TFB73118.1 S9 family peptidase [Cryobacterium flavum]SDM98418.1 Dipeptidyl aminopeptidase/acylaminoacyl peptidase [Cryobacterium flavum]
MTLESQPTPFSSLDDYIALPRVEGLALSPDGQRVVLTVATLTRDQTSYERALWSVAADGSGVPTRLTRSAKGESQAAFTAAGDVLFVSGRPDAAVAEKDTEAAQLWLLPAAGGEARAITRLTGGVSGIAAVATAARSLVIAADLLPSAADLEAEGAARKERTEKKVAAILHESYPVRFWDHDLGPAEPHLLAVSLADLHDTIAAPTINSEADAPAPYPADLPRPRDLTPTPGRTMDTAGQALTPDGSTLIVALRVAEQRSGRYVLVSIDVATGTQTTLFDEPKVDFESPTVSIDGRQVAFVRSAVSTPDGPADQEIWVADLDGGHPRRLAAEWDRWPSSLVFDSPAESPADSSQALIVTADHDGRGPIFRVPLDGGTPEQLTTDDFSYTNVSVDAQTGAIVALRSSWITPAHPVRISRSGVITTLATPAALPVVPGTITEVETVAGDGVRVRAWLLLPAGASMQHPAPLLLWIHGGPLNSWNAWSWRWSPLLAVARGYAVLLPDPALSTGYGLDFIARGWNSWGAKPYTDLLAITDAAEALPEIDESLTAAMGGSFGGYMANWVAGHTERFRAIVSHASLWSLDQFNGTTDNSEYWQSIFSAQGMIDNSPHQAVRDIVTPMLVIHGDHDYRVPIGESLRLWSELAEHHATADGSTQHKFLFFPDENHWVLKPQHAVIWYETVFAFLDQHVHGANWKRPRLLG